VPIRDTRYGKSRLALPTPLRIRLARALAADTLATAVAVTGAGPPAGSGAVLAVVDTDHDAQLVRTVGARPVRSGGPGLSLAVATGLREVPAGARTAVLLADVPAAHPADLVAVLDAVTDSNPVFLADTDGSGTTMVAGVDVGRPPRFGPDSARAHRAAGFRDLAAEGWNPTALRRDVDTLADLAAVAPLLPPGSRTRRLLAEPAMRATLTVDAVETVGALGAAPCRCYG